MRIHPSLVGTIAFVFAGWTTYSSAARRPPPPVTVRYLPSVAPPAPKPLPSPPGSFSATLTYEPAAARERPHTAASEAPTAQRDDPAPLPTAPTDRTAAAVRTPGARRPAPPQAAPGDEVPPERLETVEQPSAAASKPTGAAAERPAPHLVGGACLVCGEKADSWVEVDGRRIGYCRKHLARSAAPAGPPASAPTTQAAPPESAPAGTNAAAPSRIENARGQQCRGVTKAGARCRRATRDPSGYCYQHRSQAAGR